MRSTTPVSARRFGIALFRGFTGTFPTHEENSATAGRISDLIAPEDGPKILREKNEGVFFVPCELKVAPLVEKTLERAIRLGLPAVGKMRSGSHVTAGAWAKLDGDGLSAEQFAAMQETLNLTGVAHIIYSSHSNGRADKPGIRCRIIVFFDTALEPADYKRAVLSLSTWLLGKSLDTSESTLCQQAGVWCAHPDRTEHVFCIRQLDGVCVSTDALLAAAPPAPLRNEFQISSNAGPMPLNAERVRAALNWIDPNEYKQWIDCAFWLKASYGDSAYPLWIEWGARADQDAQAKNDGEYAPDKTWVGISPRIAPDQGAGALYAEAKDNAVAATREAAATGNWNHAARAALVYLQRFHPRLYSELFGLSA